MMSGSDRMDAFDSFFAVQGALEHVEREERLETENLPALLNEKEADRQLIPISLFSFNSTAKFNR